MSYGILICSQVPQPEHGGTHGKRLACSLYCSPRRHPRDSSHLVPRIQGERVQQDQVQPPCHRACHVARHVCPELHCPISHGSASTDPLRSRSVIS
ncbi:MAG: hypothetical protein UT32_C0005G0002 [Parcubacteria group bacterium GW2011_GWC2_39_14]|nr:MAG: hypothetical protein UT32_C0005G0002 [Parcubacteria group bacterium GW2011_GWC2_39_14]KKR54583.1 MAG: hypothetical protein UT91_C0012G0002 [Parcubacteria group bacterium GW2011_GWA2_40_23]